MRNKIENDINEFLTKTEIAKEKLSNASKSINEKDENIDKYIKDIDLFVSKQKNIKSDNKLSNEANNNISKVLENISVWKEEISKLKKNKKFINNYEKEVIVLVFGKVNSGKSSLGNFIKGDFIKKHLDTNYSKFGEIPVTIEDKGYLKTSNKLEELANEANQFGENSTEATSTIQSFRIGGLAWIDTPGIGSITKENEALAKEYVNDADLVIYLTSSDSPGTSQDFNELISLENRDKPILLVISKSDKKGYLKDENGKLVIQNGKTVKVPVAKTIENKMQQEEYLREMIVENNLDKILKYSDIISTSTQVAKYSIENERYDMFESSNLGLLYKKLGEILSEKSVELKVSNPKSRINTLIDEIIFGKENELIGINQTIEFLQENKNSIKASKDNILELKNRILNKFRRDIDSEINNFISEKVNLLNDEKEITSDEISSFVTGIANKIYNEELSKAICEILEDFDENLNKSLDINVNTSISKRYESVEYTETVVRRVSRDPRGLEWIPHLCGKEYYTNKIDKVTRSQQIDMGDNSYEVKQEIIRNVENSIKKSIDIDLKNISDSYFFILENGIDNIINELVKFKDKLLKEKY